MVLVLFNIPICKFSRRHRPCCLVLHHLLMILQYRHSYCYYYRYRCHNNHNMHIKHVAICDICAYWHTIQQAVVRAVAW